MSIQQMLIAGYSAPGIVCDSADFDGTNDFMSRGADLTGAADAKTGIFCAWLRLDGSNGVNKCVFSNAVGGATGIQLLRGSGNTFAFTGQNSAGSTIMDFVSASTYTAGASWLSVLSSWDLANNKKHLYINDVNDLGTVTTFVDDTLDYTTGGFLIGASAGGALFRWNGCIAEFYFKMGVYTDLSIVSNRRKFILGNGKPAILGTGGTLPGLGTPEVYQHLDDGEAVANFATNRGGGGNFTITGTLDTGSTSPSD